MNRSARTFLALFGALCAALALSRAAIAETVNFGTDWKAEAEHGGFYQALATGIYQKHGLDVKLRPGGPQVNHAQLLAAGVLDFNIASNSFVPLNFVQENIPMVAVAAIFQKDPSVLIAHPGQGNDSLDQLKGKPIMIGSDTRVTAWQFLKQKFSYTDDQIRPYTFSVAPFLADKKAIQQGYLTSEPYTIEKEGVQPVIMLLADAGYSSYGALIETSQKLAREKPATVTYASSGIGGAGHLAGELLRMMAQIDIVHVPYKGGGPAMQGFLGGQIDSFFATPTSSIGQINAGKARAIATTGSKRAALLPDVPTVAEAGYPGYEALNWYAYLGPARLPKDLVDRLNRELVKALGAPEVIGLLEKQGVEPQPGTPEELARYIAREYQTWGKVVKEAGIQAH